MTTRKYTAHEKNPGIWRLTNMGHSSTRNRFEFDVRWPGILEVELNTRGNRIRVIEDSLNGRRTVRDDPFKPGRNGLVGLAQCIESHSPLALVILMLGTNDFQSMHTHDIWHSAQGIAALISQIRLAPMEPGMPIPLALVVASPPIQNPRGAIAPKFTGGDEKCVRLAEAYRKVAIDHACHFFDSATVTSSSKIDGVHLDADQHLTLGKAIAAVVEPLLMKQ